MERQRDLLGIEKITKRQNRQSGFRMKNKMFETISEKTLPALPIPTPPGNSKSEAFHWAFYVVLAEAQRVFTLIV